MKLVRSRVGNTRYGWGVLITRRGIYFSRGTFSTLWSW